MARREPQVNIRMGKALKTALEAAARNNNRSLTAEINDRLAKSLMRTDKPAYQEGASYPGRTPVLFPPAVVDALLTLSAATTDWLAQYKGLHSDGEPSPVPRRNRNGP